MNKKIGIISVITGVVSAIIGVISSCMICGVFCVTGILVAIFGAGIAGVLHKYNIWFTVTGFIFFILGLFLIINSRNKCKKVEVNQYLDGLKEHYKVEKCKACVCLQGLLTQFIEDGVDGKMKGEVESMQAPKEKTHDCLGCEPCSPAEIWSSYLKAKKEQDHKKC